MDLDWKGGKKVLVTAEIVACILLQEMMDFFSSLFHTRLYQEGASRDGDYGCKLGAFGVWLAGEMQL